jgi:hypothetical protein
MVHCYSFSNKVGDEREGKVGLTCESGTILNEGIEVHSNAKEYLKVQKRTILYIFVHLVPIGAHQKTREWIAEQRETRIAMIQRPRTYQNEAKAGTLTKPFR